MVIIWTASVSDRSGQYSSGLGLDQKNGSVRFQTGPKIRPTASWQAKPVSLTVNPRVLPGLARTVLSNLHFSCSGFSIYGHIPVPYHHAQNINFGTSFSLFVLLAFFLFKISRDMLPPTC